VSVFMTTTDLEKSGNENSWGMGCGYVQLAEISRKLLGPGKSYKATEAGCRVCPFTAFHN